MAHNWPPAPSLRAWRKKNWPPWWPSQINSYPHQTLLPRSIAPSGDNLRSALLAVFTAIFAYNTPAQRIPTPPERPHKLNPDQVAQEVRDYRMNNEDRIIRERSEEHTSELQSLI